MTPKQREYVKHRARGLGKERAAIAAGYAARSAQTTASDLEKDPSIKGAIREARQAAGAMQAHRKYADPLTYLLAVVAGREEPDPVRCGAAKAALPYLAPVRRAPKGRAVKPRDQAHIEALEAQAEADRKWAAKADRIRARLGRNGDRHD